MKKKEDLIKTSLDTIKELASAKSQKSLPLNKTILTSVVDSDSNLDINSPTSIENSEPPSKILTQDFNLNHIDGEEPPSNKKKKRSL